MSETNYTGKIVAVLAKDHSSSKAMSKEDLDRIRKGTATLIAIGLVMGDEDGKLLISSFFTDFQGDFAYHDIHSILKKEIVRVEVLKDIPGVDGSKAAL
jgi:hypothetical protein